MTQCVTFVGGVLAESAAVPCDGYVLVTALEYEQLAHNPFKLSLEDGVAISGAIAAVWSLAWVLRVIGRFLQSDGEALDER